MILYEYIDLKLWVYVELKSLLRPAMNGTA